MAGNLWKAAGYVPVTILIIGGVAGWLASNGHYANTDSIVTVFPRILNPLYYFESLLLHTDWNHYRGNMTTLGFVPVGVLLTYLTSNRHVLGVVLMSQFLAVFVYGIGMWSVVYGSSPAAFGLWGATVVGLAGLAGQNHSSTGLGVLLLGIMVPFGGVLLLISVSDAGSGIAHFTHLLGFVFGGAYEAIYVFSERERERAAAETGGSRQAPWQG
jgi:membrane associated rhomboid family serine protease